MEAMAHRKFDGLPNLKMLMPPRCSMLKPQGKSRHQREQRKAVREGVVQAWSADEINWLYPAW